MIIVQRTDDGREIRWRPENFLERLAHELADGMLTDAQAADRVRSAFDGRTEEWYRDIFSQWFGWP